MSEITGPNEALPPAIQLNEPPRLPPPVLEPPPPTAPVLRPVPFEDPEAFPGFWPRVGGMFKLVFSNPMELFDRVPVTEGLGAPWRFLLLLSIPVFLLMALIFFLVGMVAVVALLEQSSRTETHRIAAFLPFILGGLLLLMPLFSFLGMIIGGALNHFCLWMWGGLKPGVGLGQTIRVNGYVSAYSIVVMFPFQILGMIPFIGIMFSLFALLAKITLTVVEGMGLARTHKTDTWRGICAALTPLFLFCCCGILLAIIVAISIPALIAARHH